MSYALNKKFFRPTRDLFDVMLFAALCGAPLVMTLMGGSGSSVASEFRKPTPLPGWPSTLSECLSFPSALERYLNDHFGGRALLIRLNSYSRFLISASGNERLIVGNDGWLFLSKEDGVLDRHRGLLMFSPEELKSWVDEYQRRMEWLQNQGIKGFMFIVPNKHSVYPEQIPNRYKGATITMTDQLVKALEDRGISGVVDLRGFLRESRKHLDVYSKLDSHWTDRGRYIAHTEIINTVRNSCIKARQLSEIDLSFSVANSSGDLGRILGLDGVISENLEMVSIENSTRVRREGVNFRTELVTTITSLDDLSEVLIMCDSFVGGHRARYLEESFSKSHLRHHGRLMFDAGLIENIKPDAVIYIIVERLLPKQLKRTVLPTQK